jgi:short-subunit dehydrogenase
MGFLRPLNPPIRRWDGQRVWIVGASSGIGAALARALAARGAWVALSARRREALEDIAAACGGEALVEPMDVTCPEDFERVRERLLAAWGRLDLVVFNAGTYRPARRRAHPAGDPRHPSHQPARHDGRRGRGRATVHPAGRGGVALVGSVAGYGGLPKATVYGPGKAALINFAETLYLDLAPAGVSVFLVNPGFVATPLTAQNDFTMPALMTPEAAAEAMLAGFARGFRDPLPPPFHPGAEAAAPLARRLYFALIHRLTGL